MLKVPGSTLMWYSPDNGASSVESYHIICRLCLLLVSLSEISLVNKFWLLHKLSPFKFLNILKTNLT